LAPCRQACVPAAGWKISHFWGTETLNNHVDILTPPQNFRSEFLEKHYLNKK
jgi:hypothetical protein